METAKINKKFYEINKKTKSFRTIAKWGFAFEIIWWILFIPFIIQVILLHNYLIYFFTNENIVFFSILLIVSSLMILFGIICWTKSKKFEEEYECKITKYAILSTFLGIFCFNILCNKINMAIRKKNHIVNNQHPNNLNNIKMNNPNIFNDHQAQLNNSMNEASNFSKYNSAQSNTRQKIIEINNLRDQGLLSEEEYQEARKKIIENL